MQSDATSQCYEVLIPISRGYSPVKGRLHTRYAPVRRSCTPERALPLDLHVLGLPLAFILSQDQTLHSILFVLFFKRIFVYAVRSRQSVVFYFRSVIKTNPLCSFTWLGFIMSMNAPVLPGISFFIFPLRLSHHSFISNGAAKVMLFISCATF